MEKDETKKITAENIHIRLAAVQFKALPQVDGNFNVVSFDTVEVKAASKEGFSILYSREVRLDPSAIFSLLVAFEVSGTFDQASLDFYKDDPKGFGRWVSKYQDNLVGDSGAPRLASALIASITAYDGLNPVVLAPILHKRKETNDNAKSAK
jgi:hypothetical protein